LPAIKTRDDGRQPQSRTAQKRAPEGVTRIAAMAQRFDPAGVPVPTNGQDGLWPSDSLYPLQADPPAASPGAAPVPAPQHPIRLQTSPPPARAGPPQAPRATDRRQPSNSMFPCDHYQSLRRGQTPVKHTFPPSPPALNLRPRLVYAAWAGSDGRNVWGHRTNTRSGMLRAVKRVGRWVDVEGGTGLSGPHTRRGRSRARTLSLSNRNARCCSKKMS
jgi:hypothetical protein